MAVPSEGSVLPSERWLLRLLYAILIVSAIALVTLLLGNVIATLEGGEHADGTDEGLHHLFVFDLAWPVFLIGSVSTLVAGVGALIAGWLRSSFGLKRYGTWALGYTVVAALVAVVAGGIEF